MKSIPGFFSRAVPDKLLVKIVSIFLESVAKAKNPRDGLLFLFYVERDLYFLTGAKAGEYGQGLHPKHVHTKYHDFFIERISANENVLDIGCGAGALAYDIALTGAFVTGIDISEENVTKAKRIYAAENLRYFCGDALQGLPESKFDTIVLSNVLEHVEYRINFLKSIIERIQPKRFLIRVPMYERDWRIPLMEEVGVDYRLDHTHYTEYKKSEFNEELQNSGLDIVSIEYIWGEIWCEATVCIK